MKIILLKDHNGWLAGSEQEVAPDLANYLVRCNVAVYSDSTTVTSKQVKPKTPSKPKVPKKPKEPKQNKQVKPKIEKK